MTNWCTNRVTVVGAAAAVRALAQQVAGGDDADQSSFLLNNVIPLTGHLDPIERVQQWGTSREPVVYDGPTHVTLPGDRLAVCWGMDTAWSPPSQAIATLAELHPEVSVRIEYEESGGCLYGAQVYEANHIRLDVRLDDARVRLHNAELESLVGAVEAATEIALDTAFDLVLVAAEQPHTVPEMPRWLPMAWPTGWGARLDVAEEMLAAVLGDAAEANDWHEQYGSWDTPAAERLFDRLTDPEATEHLPVEQRLQALAFLIAYRSGGPVGPGARHLAGTLLNRGNYLDTLGTVAALPPAGPETSHDQYLRAVEVALTPSRR